MTAPGSRTRAEAEADARRRPHECTRLGCDKPAVKRLQRSDGGTPWFGCAKHWSAMNDSLHIGLPGATSGGGWVEVTDWRAKS